MPGVTWNSSGHGLEGRGHHGYIPNQKWCQHVPKRGEKKLNRAKPKLLENNDWKMVAMVYYTWEAKICCISWSITLIPGVLFEESLRQSQASTNRAKFSQSQPRGVETSACLLGSCTLRSYWDIPRSSKINIVTLAIGCVADLTLRHAALREAAAAAIDHAQANGAWKVPCWPIVV